MKVRRSITKQENYQKLEERQYQSKYRSYLSQNKASLQEHTLLSLGKKKPFSIQELSQRKDLKSQIAVVLPKIGQKKMAEQRLENKSMLLKEDRALKIALKPVPKKQASNKHSFGWAVDKGNGSIIEQLVINKSCNSYSVESLKYKNQWLLTINQVKKQLQMASAKLCILPCEFWTYLLGKFSNFHLHVDEKVELLELISKFFERGENFYETKDEFDFCGEIGSKFQKMENRIYFKHKYSLQYAKFMIAQNIHKQRFYSKHFYEFNFDMSPQEVFELFGIVRNFCQNNMDAFAFISLYFQISLKNNLKQYRFKKVEQDFISIIDQISKKYPPSQEVSQENDNSYYLADTKQQHQFEILKFEDSRKSHFEQLKEYLIKKTEQAKEEQSLFRQLVEDICFKYGYSLKTGVKIKSVQSKGSMFRTIEKLFSQDRFKEALSQFKNQSKQNNYQSQRFSEQIILNEIQMCETKIAQILQAEQSLTVDVKDLLRGKCTFAKIEEINETVHLLETHIQKRGFKVIERKNRLSKSTKDISLIIGLPNSIAQLQLALKLDSISNEFNHKIYELARSQIYTPITNLFVHNQTWCESFFTDQFELFQEMINLPRELDFQEQITFRRLKKDISHFKKIFLETNAIKYEKSFKTKQQDKLKVLQKLKEIKGLSNQLQTGPINSKEQIQKFQRQNVINFQKTFDYEKALQSIEAIDQREIETNLRLLKLKGDIMKHHGKYKQAYESYQKYLKIHKKENQDNLELAEVLESMGSVHDTKQQYNEAIDYYQKSLEIKQKINGQQTIEVAASLSGIGEVYSNMKLPQTYAQALQYHMKALKIRQGLLRKQSIDVAASLNNIGVVYRRSGDYYRALDYFKQSLEIRQKIMGKESLGASNSLYHIGIVHRLKKEFHKSLDYLQRAIQIKQKILGKESLEVAKVYLELSYVYEDLEQFQKAHSSIGFAYLVFKKILGDDHGKTKLSYQQYKDVGLKLEKKLKGSYFGSKLYLALKQEENRVLKRNHK